MLLLLPVDARCALAHCVGGRGCFGERPRGVRAPIEKRGSHKQKKCAKRNEDWYVYFYNYKLKRRERRRGRPSPM